MYGSTKRTFNHTAGGNDHINFPQSLSECFFQCTWRVSSNTQVYDLEAHAPAANGRHDGGSITIADLTQSKRTSAGMLNDFVAGREDAYGWFLVDLHGGSTDGCKKSQFTANG
ncbi:hypothetical protein HYFRA_00004599 [Hymenoscyphus fraxineus]|uniref:Uncharacterized protein n=1 Tax=Hymenoscyphus fraxineus TaxID=746836 RepID=A0A9N9KZ93_9HELO|nr:hypothetical protein HYFRA_00004599 [Hymenoscyphus fraxineus]